MAMATHDHILNILGYRNITQGQFYFILRIDHFPPLSILKSILNIKIKF